MGEAVEENLQGKGPGQEPEVGEDTQPLPPVMILSMSTEFWEELETLLRNVPVKIISEKIVEARLQRQAKEHVERKEREAPLPPRWKTGRRRG